MTRQEKEKEVAWYREQFQGIKALFLTDFKGLTVEEMNRLRADIRNVGTSYKVLKNTLVRRAYEDTDVALLGGDIVGPRAAAWTAEDDKVPPLAKVLADFAKNHEKLELVRAVVSGQVVDPAGVVALSKLPARDVLLGGLLGSMLAPVGGFVNTLAAVPRALLNVLKAIEEQKNASSESAAG